MSERKRSSRVVGNEEQKPPLVVQDCPGGASLIAISKGEKWGFYFQYLVRLLGHYCMTIASIIEDNGIHATNRVL